MNYIRTDEEVRGEGTGRWGNPGLEGSPAGKGTFLLGSQVGPREKRFPSYIPDAGLFSPAQHTCTLTAFTAASACSLLGCSG